FQCQSGGILFGFFFGFAGAFTFEDALNEDAGGKGFVVVGTKFIKDAVADGAFVVLGDFLEQGFVVAVLVLVDFFDDGYEQIKDKLAGGLKAFLQIVSADDGFESVGQDGGTFASAGNLFAAAQMEGLA